MKVSIDYYHLRLPRKSFKIATGTREFAEVVIVKAEGDGIIGLGSGTPSEIYNDSIERCIKALSSTVKTTIDLDSYFRGDIPTNLLSLSKSASAALDIAIWDLKGNIEGKTLTEMLSGTLRTIEISRTIDICDSGTAIRDAEEFVDSGYRIIKIKVGESLKEDILRVRAVRETVGDDIRLIADANSGYKYDEAVKFWGELSNLNIELFEQPIGPQEHQSLSRLRREYGLKICVDESVYDIQSLKAIISSDAADAINIKLMKCGGISQALRLIKVARDAGLDIMVGCMGDIGISIAAAAHVANAINAEYADLDSHLSIESICKGLTVKNGRLYLTNKAGISTALLPNWKKWEVL